jgi:hypothetical protein
VALPVGGCGGRAALQARRPTRCCTCCSRARVAQCPFTCAAPRGRLCTTPYTLTRTAARTRRWGCAATPCGFGRARAARGPRVGALGCARRRRGRSVGRCGRRRGPGAQCFVGTGVVTTHLALQGVDDRDGALRLRGTEGVAASARRNGAVSACSRQNFRSSPAPPRAYTAPPLALVQVFVTAERSCAYFDRKILCVFFCDFFRWRVSQSQVRLLKGLISRSCPCPCRLARPAPELGQALPWRVPYHPWFVFSPQP